MCKRDLERVECYVKCLVRLYQCWEVQGIRKFVKELMWMVKGSKGKHSKDRLQELRFLHIKQ